MRENHEIVYISYHPSYDDVRILDDKPKYKSLGFWIAERCQKNKSKSIRECFATNNTIEIFVCLFVCLHRVHCMGVYYTYIYKIRP